MGTERPGDSGVRGCYNQTETLPVREAIDAEPYRVAPRMAKLKRLLAKLEPVT